MGARCRGWPPALSCAAGSGSDRQSYEPSAGWRAQRDDGSRHSPDLGLVHADGRRTAIEVELQPKSRARLASILGGYRELIHAGLLSDVSYVTDRTDVTELVRRRSAQGAGERARADRAARADHRQHSGARRGSARRRARGGRARARGRTEGRLSVRAARSCSVLPLPTRAAVSRAGPLTGLTRRATVNISLSNPTLTVGVSLLAGVLSVGVGAGGAWWLHRRTRLSPRNAYLLWIACCALVVAAAAAQSPIAIGGALWLLLASQTASLLGRRWRIAALGAGGELRDHERARVMAWTALRQRDAHARASAFTSPAKASSSAGAAGPSSVRALPMTGDGRALLPLEEGHHQLYVGATGSGKTTSARRVLLARGLGEPSVALLALDPKGDPGLERDLRAIAAARRAAVRRV